MKKKRSSFTYTASVDVEVDVEVDVGNLEDDELELCYQEYVRRQGAKAAVPKATTTHQRLSDVLESLLARRHDGIVEKFEAAILGGDNTALTDAYRALRTGDWNAAICFLDRALVPSPAVSADALPLRRGIPATEVVQKPD